MYVKSIVWIDLKQDNVIDPILDAVKATVELRV